MKTIISLCDHTGNMVRPWADAGYECYCLDLQENKPSHPNIRHIKMDVKKFLKSSLFKKLSKKSVEAVFAFPPCTDLAVCGAKWFKDKYIKDPKYREKAMSLVYACVEVAERFGVPYFIENPVSVISSEWRKPDFTFNPHEYGGYKGGENDSYTKRTCLWSGNGFTLPEKKPIEPTEGSRMQNNYGGKSLRTKNARSETPKGFARAIFEHLTKGGTA